MRSKRKEGVIRPNSFDYRYSDSRVRMGSIPSGYKEVIGLQYKNHPWRKSNRVGNQGSISSNCSAETNKTIRENICASSQRGKRISSFSKSSLSFNAQNRERKKNISSFLEWRRDCKNINDHKGGNLTYKELSNENNGLIKRIRELAAIKHKIDTNTEYWTEEKYINQPSPDRTESNKSIIDATILKPELIRIRGITLFSQRENGTDPHMYAIALAKRECWNRMFKDKAKAKDALLLQAFYSLFCTLAHDENIHKIETLCNIIGRDSNLSALNNQRISKANFIAELIKVMNENCFSKRVEKLIYSGCNIHSFPQCGVLLIIEILSSPQAYNNCFSSRRITVNPQEVLSEPLNSLETFFSKIVTIISDTFDLQISPSLPYLTTKLQISGKENAPTCPNSTKRKLRLKSGKLTQERPLKSFFKVLAKSNTEKAVEPLLSTNFELFNLIDMMEMNTTTLISKSLHTRS